MVNQSFNDVFGSLPISSEEKLKFEGSTPSDYIDLTIDSFKSHRVTESLQYLKDLATSIQLTQSLLDLPNDSQMSDLLPTIFEYAWVRQYPKIQASALTLLLVFQHKNSNVKCINNPVFFELLLPFTNDPSSNICFYALLCCLLFLEMDPQALTPYCKQRLPIPILISYIRKENSLSNVREISYFILNRYSFSSKIITTEELEMIHSLNYNILQLDSNNPDGTFLSLWKDSFWSIYLLASSLFPKVSVNPHIFNRAEQILTTETKDSLISAALFYELAVNSKISIPTFTICDDERQTSLFSSDNANNDFYCFIVTDIVKVMLSQGYSSKLLYDLGFVSFAFQAEHHFKQESIIKPFCQVINGYEKPMIKRLISLKGYRTLLLWIIQYDVFKDDVFQILLIMKKVIEEGISNKGESFISDFIQYEGRSIIKELMDDSDTRVSDEAKLINEKFFTLPLFIQYPDPDNEDNEEEISENDDKDKEISESDDNEEESYIENKEESNNC